VLHRLRHLPARGREADVVPQVSGAESDRRDEKGAAVAVVVSCHCTRHSLFAPPRTRRGHTRCGRRAP
jgi:hypothetical protein